MPEKAGKGRPWGCREGICHEHMLQVLQEVIPAEAGIQGFHRSWSYYLGENDWVHGGLTIREIIQERVLYSVGIKN